MIAGVKHHPELLLKRSKEVQHWDYFGCELAALWGMYSICHEKTSEALETLEGLVLLPTMPSLEGNILYISY